MPDLLQWLLGDFYTDQRNPQDSITIGKTLAFENQIRLAIKRDESFAAAIRLLDKAIRLEGARRLSIQSRSVRQVA